MAGDAGVLGDIMAKGAPTAATAMAAAAGPTSSAPAPVPAPALTSGPEATPYGTTTMKSTPITAAKRARAAKLARKKPKNCAVGMDREKRIVVHCAGKSGRVPRAILPMALVVVLMVIFVRSGTSQTHIAKAEVRGAYRGSIDGALLTVLAGAVGTLGEVSSGAFFVPLFIAVEGLSPHDAIPLSIATILGAAVVNLVRDYSLVHPLRPHRKLIDFETATTLAPCVAAGTLFGVYVDKLLPPWMLTLLLTATLLFVTVKTARQGRAELRDPLALMDPSLHTGAAGVDDGDDDDDGGGDTEEGAGTGLIASEAIAAAGNPSPQQQGVAQLATLEGSSAAAERTLQLMAGATLAASAVQGMAQVSGGCGGAVFFAGPVACVFAFIGAGVQHSTALLESHAKKQQVASGFEYARGDIQWTETVLTGACAKALWSGAVAGSLGLGAGPTVLPSPRVLGMLPAVSAATSALVTGMASFVGVTQFVVVGLLPPALGLWQCMLGALGSMIGSQIRRHKLLTMTPAAAAGSSAAASRRCAPAIVSFWCMLRCARMCACCFRLS